MVDFELDDQRDSNYDRSDRDITSTDEFIQRVLIFLNTNIGEIPWNLDFGIDQNQVFLDIKDQAALSVDFNEWLTVQFEDEIASATVTKVDYNQRKATIYIAITMLDGSKLNITKEATIDGI
ncbi:hypothetical protein [Secundilactobacillus kimchicus]|uniref:hypothetical protein n=1 Tax=Secundilactobacillus kimchicus TaxID=528209 RepID=UPI0024A976CD|nr:hypothetical protein [Secundilactobacillus kimchicus]